MAAKKVRAKKPILKEVVSEPVLHGDSSIPSDASADAGKQQAHRAGEALSFAAMRFLALLLVETIKRYPVEKRMQEALERALAKAGGPGATNVTTFTMRQALPTIVDATRRRESIVMAARLAEFAIEYLETIEQTQVVPDAEFDLVTKLHNVLRGGRVDTDSARRHYDFLVAVAKMKSIAKEASNDEWQRWNRSIAERCGIAYEEQVEDLRLVFERESEVGIALELYRRAYARYEGLASAMVLLNRLADADDAGDMKKARRRFENALRQRDG